MKRVAAAALPVAALVAALVAASIHLAAQRPDAFTASRDHAAVQYTTRPADTSVTRLMRDLDAGTAKLTFDRTNGYLRALLEALALPADSQLLVFSATSAQAPLVSPSNPRAIYFNDSTAVGWIRGAGFLEIAAHDARQGTIFYTLDQQAVAKPQLKRQDGCLECHLTWDTLGVPGFTMLSTFPMSDDKNAYATGVTVDHRTDLDQRWGGWYVTGASVPPRHFGNLPVVRPARDLARPAPPPPVLRSVSGRFDTAALLTPYSDIVSSMVFAHQAHMTNHLTRLGWEARVAERTPGDPKVASRIPQAVRDVVDYLLFVDEAPISQPIQGSSGFAESFAKRGPRDARGRSLRDLDLVHHLFRYPCSYMVYAPAFDALPPAVLDQVYRRMWTILSGAETDKRYAALSRADRTAIVEILRDTKNTLPAYFTSPNR